MCEPQADGVYIKIGNVRQGFLEATTGYDSGIHSISFMDHPSFSICLIPLVAEFQS